MVRQLAASAAGEAVDELGWRACILSMAGPS
jgi:hypothetical protein